MPDQVLCSSATRTCETLSLMSVKAEVTTTSELYHASARQMLQVLSDATKPKVMMVGHNPGIGDLAQRLAMSVPWHGRFLDYPTGATTVLRFAATRWADVDFGAGEVIDFVVPRELL